MSWASIVRPSRWVGAAHHRDRRGDHALELRQHTASAAYFAIGDYHQAIDLL
jgi:hypothetical protein